MSSRRAITCFYHHNFFQLISIALLLFYRFLQKIILVLITIFQLTKIELLTTISTRLHSQQTTCRSVHVESSRAACCIRRLILREVRRFWDTTHGTSQSSVTHRYGTKVCRYNWHSAGSLGWLLSITNAKIFSYKIHGSNVNKQHSETVVFEISKMLMSVLKINLLCYLL